MVLHGFELPALHGAPLSLGPVSMGFDQSYGAPLNPSRRAVASSVTSSSRQRMNARLTAAVGPSDLRISPWR
jgi:hypothetical protein